MWKKTKNENKIRNVWICQKCEKMAYVYPSDYAEIGTPVCSDCDEDMQYLHTEIDEE